MAIEYQPWFKQKWMTYKFKHIITRLDLDYEYFFKEKNKTFNGCYYIFCTETKQDYIGESKNIKGRFQSELNDAKKKGWYPEKRKFNNDSKNNHFMTNCMAKIGWEKWIFLPIKILQENTGKIIRIRFEKSLIQHLQPKMNRKYNNCNLISYHKNKNTDLKNKRNREHIGKRRKYKNCVCGAKRKNCCSADCYYQNSYNTYSKIHFNKTTMYKINTKKRLISQKH